MFELPNLETPIALKNSKPSHYWLCTSCRNVSLACRSCNSCENKKFIPFLDRRPLLLSKELCNGVVDLINAAADNIGNMEIEESISCNNEYLPFLSQLLSDSAKAQERASLGEMGWRSTSMATSEVLALFEQSQIPPTESF